MPDDVRLTYRAFAAAGLGHRVRWLPRGVEAAAPN